MERRIINRIREKGIIGVLQEEAGKIEILQKGKPREVIQTMRKRRGL